MKSILLAALAVIALSLGCSDDDSDPVLSLDIGIVQSTTGAAAPYGKSVVNGIELAIRQYEADDLQISQQVLDDKSTPEGGSAAFTTLTSQDVDAIIGPTLSAVGLEALKVSQAAGIPALGATLTAAGIPETGSFVFRTALSERNVVPATLKYVTRETPIRTAVLIVNSSDAFSRSSADAMKYGLDQIGGSVMLEIDVAKTPDYAGALAGIRDAQFDAFLVSPLLELSGPIVRTIRNQGFTQPLVGGNGFNTLDIVAASMGAVNGAYVGAPWNPAVDTKVSKEFVAAYSAAYGAAPDLYAAQGYATVEILVAAVRKAGSTEPEAIRVALAGLRGVDTIFGTISISQDREALYEPVVQQYRDGKLVVVD